MKDKKHRIKFLKNRFSAQSSNFQKQVFKLLYETSLGRQQKPAELYVELYDWLGARRRMQIRGALWQCPQSFFDKPVKIELSELPHIGEMPSAYTPSAEEWAYLSGYFLAEGSIAFDNRSQQAYARPSLHLSSTDQDVIAYCAKLLATSYREANRRTKKGKKVFVLNLTNFENLAFTLKNILPFISVSSRHREKVEKALQEMQKRMEARRDSSIQKTIRLNLQKELDTFEPKGAPTVNWEELASILQEHSFIYFVDTPSAYGIAQTVRLQFKSNDFQTCEKVAKVFGNKLNTVKRTKKNHKPIYKTQIEKKKSVFWILKNVLPFLTGKAHMQAEEAVNFFQSADFMTSSPYKKTSSGKDEEKSEHSDVE